MRLAFSQYLEEKLIQRNDAVFITGDLGFNAFETLRQNLGHRFINAGVAEQNMVGMAAGIASQGFMVFVYSIAPFLYMRALEQIRNDVCFHKLPVFFVGNGGGFGYGIMGSSHHAIEDLSVFSSLPNLTSYVPASKEQIAPTIDEIIFRKSPAYLRLGTGFSANYAFNPSQDFQQIQRSDNPKLTVIAQGSVVNNLVQSIYFDAIKDAIDLFICTRLPFHSLPKELEDSLKKSQKLFCFEEHIQSGGLGEKLAYALLKSDLKLKLFTASHALPYPTNTYGSQGFHQTESGLDAESLYKNILISIES